MPECTLCLPNSESLSGSDARSDCLCSLGFSGLPDGLCTECPVNEYEDALNMSACTACLANSEAPVRSDNREDCRCSLGFYGPYCVRWRVVVCVGVLRTGPVAAGVWVYSSVSHL